jgi:multiple sugar transport system permease protein
MIDAVRQKGHFWTTESKLAYVLLIPGTIFLLLFMFYPIFYVFLMSLFKTSRLGKIVGFFGLGNFKYLIKIRDFWDVLGRSFIWTGLAVLVKTLFGIAIALLLNVDYRGRRVYRTLLILPWASSIPISVMLWQWVYNADFGLLNQTLKLLHITQQPPFWLAYPIPAFVAAIWVDIWIGIPFMSLVFLAGLQAIPRDLYEAAVVDGVNAIQKFRLVTLPLLKNLIVIATLLSILWTFNDFNTIYILTKGGPINTTDILITFIYKYSFNFLRFGPAAAMAVITFVILLAISIIYSRFYFKSEE